MPTQQDIAREVGCHVSTVSRALNEATRGSVTPELVAQILAAAERLAYVRNNAGYSLRTNRTQIIGVVMPDIANPIFPPIFRGVESALLHRDYLVVQVNSEAGDERHEALMARLRTRVDGLILGSLLRNDATLSRLLDQGVHIVTINRRGDDARASSVTHDEDAGVRLALEHLKELGHKRVVNIASPRNVSTGHARYEAFERHRALLGLDTSPELVMYANRMSEAEGERCAALALDTVKDFTAIVASNDRLAVGALALMRQREIDCPAEVSLTGFNDMPMVDRLDPPLTSVRVKQTELGVCAAEMLLERIERGQSAEVRHVVMPVALIARGSTAAPRRTRRSAGRGSRGGGGPPA